MADKKNKKTPKAEAASETTDMLQAQIIELIKVQYDMRLEGIEEDVESVESRVSNVKTGLHERMGLLEAKLDQKIDGIDQALRGNGRIGLFEQHRNLKTFVRIIFVIIMLLLGAKMWGFGLDDWVKKFFVSQETKQVEPAIKDSP